MLAIDHLGEVIKNMALEAMLEKLVCIKQNALD